MRFIRSVAKNRVRPALPILACVALLVLLPTAALAAGDPLSNAALKLQEIFTGTIAKALAAVAVVVGGLCWAYGEGQKKQLGQMAVGVALAVGAVNFVAWLTS